MNDIIAANETPEMPQEEAPKALLSPDDQLIEDSFNELLQDYLNSNHRRKVERIRKAFDFANQAHEIGRASCRERVCQYV